MNNEVLLKVEEKINPPAHILEEAHIKDYESIYKKSIENPDAFWTEVAQDITWFKPFSKVLEWNFPYAKWFLDAKLNASYNCLDRHIEEGHRNKVAYIGVNEDLEEHKITYGELLELVNRLANGLKSLGLKKGDRVSIYMPNTVEAVASMLACARIGVIHQVVFAGFSEGALRTRVGDAGASAIITATYTKRRGKKVELLPTALEAIKGLDSIKHVICWDRDNAGLPEGVLSFYDIVKSQKPECEPEHMDSEDPLFILYTSGTTGKPKGVIHTTGGYMVNVHFTTKNVFALKPNDIYWCTADIGWITGHSYIVYGPLSVGVTSVIFEGAPDYKDPSTWWKIVEKYRVNKFYTAPTAVRLFMRYGEQWPEAHDLSSLKILGSVGEPINPEAWHWYYEHIGHKNCAIVDTWWQTETGAHMITTLPGNPMKPGKAGKPLPGVEVAIVDKNGNPVPPNTVGYIVIKNPWPSMMRDCWGQPERYKKYWTEIPGNVYNADDLGSIDEEGYIMIVGRADDVLSVAGHRIGTMEVESAIVDHEAVAEAAVIGKPDPIKGEHIKAFVILKQGYTPSEELKKSIQEHVKHVLGAIAYPEEIEFVDKLPKTRSGKIMRRILKAKELGLDVGDVSTLED
ncbi:MULTISPECIES: acetate--CoA ligase [unclassified Hydrogenobaculum]|uniref:acetate--CoA ligase n=1 Tax=unclassified Hydrogenobaculum TaxID=2622382 RepID=UPI0001C502AC|nr:MULTISPECIES: acetate--CoA ligase [unclassified Hydrogenobaculum]AEF18498.1 acetate/CoA ligase [Hydrogenobaculum sp. 3684]AEG45788.1 acetate/CoA ligase [Hydrogenobaculum sp. SHO]AGG14429.1 acetate/CoA ligase [Hydrogenobaculum sp. HO]AGH92734.1 acetate--CoA ligase [Hydrogenobaculum sp. SN]